MDSDYHDDGDDTGWEAGDASRGAAAKGREWEERVSRTSDVNEWGD